MPPTITPEVFIAKWEAVTLNEKATAQEHFIDLCRLLGLPTPNDADPKGQFFRFEKPLTKAGGSAGFADVWYRDRFAWEYKTKGKYPDLRAAYQQLLLYKEDLDNPPILVACDIASFEVHVAFTGYRTLVDRFTNADLANARYRTLLRQIFTDPEQLRPRERAETITERAAGRFAEVAQFLERRGFMPAQIAPFFMRVLFALFAEDIKILPADLMSQSLRQSIRNPAEFPDRARALFRAMREGGYFGLDRVPRFNGWLFDDDTALPLNANELQFLDDAARLDWSSVEPAIFGTLFERSLDPAKRAQLGAHYTSRDDILLLVEPVLMQPLRRAWAAAREGIEALRAQWEPLSGNARRKLQSVAEGVLLDVMEQLANTRVLDPSCGSGNFLYVALNQLKDMEKEIWQYAGGLGLAQPELGVSPAQLYGIEKNPFAAELAQVVVWIGYLQWLRANGFLEGPPPEPILQSLHTIECGDAILAFDDAGKPAEPPWPVADVIVGNPPFLGGNRVRQVLGTDYVDTLFDLYRERIPAFADLVCYWFERARGLIAVGKVQRAGLLATNSITGGANRRVLERIKESGNIFMAWRDRDWVLDGAAVRVSMVGFDDGREVERALDGVPILSISANLRGDIDLTKAQRLLENAEIAFIGDTKKGQFDISAEVAVSMLQLPINPNGRPNRDVIKPWINGLDITRRPRNMWIIDFGVDMAEKDASLYEQPYKYVRQKVKPERDQVRNALERERWWLHGRSAPDMRQALANLRQYIATPRVAKHRLFVFVSAETLADGQVVVFARSDDYFLGVLHARPHEVWSLRMGTTLEDRPRYSQTFTFETYPFPWSPGHEPQGDERVEAIAEAAHELVARRDQWLSGEGAPELPVEKRTLTTLYNLRPDWLADAHHQLDAAVLDAYGWPRDLGGDEVLARLLALNAERAAVGDVAGVAAQAADDEAQPEH